jgi:hypothetical protein
MVRLRAYHAAAAGKLRVSRTGSRTHIPAAVRLLIAAALTLFFGTVSGSVGHAQSGPFAGMAGVWAGAGTVTLDDGSTERIRCRANYAVGNGGAGLNLTLTCASDSYKFDLRGALISDRGALSGTWGESSRGINGTLEGRGSGGNFQLIASAAGFNANLSLTTRGNRQSIVIRPESGFRGASISLSRS